MRINHRRITDDKHCTIINDVLTVSTPQTAYYPHFFPHFSVRPELSRRVIYVQPPNLSFVHGELVEPYTYIPTCHIEFEALGIAGVIRPVYFRNQRNAA